MTIKQLISLSFSEQFNVAKIPAGHSTIFSVTSQTNFSSEFESCFTLYMHLWSRYVGIDVAKEKQCFATFSGLFLTKKGTTMLQCLKLFFILALTVSWKISVVTSLLSLFSAWIYSLNGKQCRLFVSTNRSWICQQCGLGGRLLVRPHIKILLGSLMKQKNDDNTLWTQDLFGVCVARSVRWSWRATGTLIGCPAAFFTPTEPSWRRPAETEWWNSLLVPVLLLLAHQENRYYHVLFSLFFRTQTCTDTTVLLPLSSQCSFVNNFFVFSPLSFLFHLLSINRMR